MALEAFHDLRAGVGDAVLHAARVGVAWGKIFYPFEVALAVFQVELVVQFTDRCDGLDACAEIPERGAAGKCPGMAGLRLRGVLGGMAGFAGIRACVLGVSCAKGQKEQGCFSLSVLLE